MHSQENKVFLIHLLLTRYFVAGKICFIYLWSAKPLHMSPNTFSSFQMKIHTSLITRDNFASAKKFVNLQNKVAKSGFLGFLLLNLKPQHQLQMRV